MMLAVFASAAPLTSAVYVVALGGGSMLGECISPLHDHRAVSDGCSCTVEVRPMHEDVVVSPSSRLVNFPPSVCIGGCSLHNPPCIIDCMHGGLST